MLKNNGLIVCLKEIGFTGGRLLIINLFIVCLYSSYKSSTHLNILLGDEILTILLEISFTKFERAQTI